MSSVIPETAKACVNACARANRTYYYKNHDRVLEIQKNYYNANKEKIRARKRARYQRLKAERAAAMAVTTETAEI